MDTNTQPSELPEASVQDSQRQDEQIELLRSTWIGKIAGSSAMLGATMIAVLALVATYSVVQRAVSGAPVPGLVDLGTLGIVFVAFAGIAEAEIDEAHVRVAGVVDRLPRIAGGVMRALSELIMTGLVAVMIWATAGRAWGSYGIGERQYGGEEWVVWPFKFVIVIGLVFLLAVCVMKLVCTVRLLFSGRAPVIVKAEETPWIS